MLQNVGFAAALEFALSHAVQDAPAEKRFVYEFHCDDAIEERSELAAERADADLSHRAGSSEQHLATR